MSVSRNVCLSGTRGHSQLSTLEAVSIDPYIQIAAPELADIVVENNVSMHRTESRLHTMLNHGIAFKFADKKIPLKEGY
jgi:hypothetical protein